MSKYKDSKPDEAVTKAVVGGGLAVGDKCWYIPGRAHAFVKDKNNSFPWVFGLRKGFAVRGGEQVEDIKEMTDADALGYFALMRNAPTPGDLRAAIVLIRPKQRWPAVVTGVNADGTVTLDVQHHNDAVTLHETAVAVDEAEKKPHSCRPLTADEAAGKFTAVTPRDLWAFDKLLTNAGLQGSAFIPETGGQ